MKTPISISSIQQLFTEARTHHAWQDKPVEDGLLHEIYDLAKWGGEGGATVTVIIICLVTGYRIKRKVVVAGQPERTRINGSQSVGAMCRGAAE